jgi:hypothetical protein
LIIVVSMMERRSYQTLLAIGNTEFTLGLSSVKGVGLSFKDDELDSDFIGVISEVVYDYYGHTDLGEVLNGVVETEFESQGVERILTNTHEPESWRVGEAFAESYLTHNRVCFFPWPDGRDERKSGSSLPGADLVGFHCQGSIERFAFGEVKTSSDRTYPPGTMYGRTGLKQQIEDLIGNLSIRDDLVKYLGHRACNSSWLDRYRESTKRYLNNDLDVSIFGLLIRDVTPNEDGLRTRVSKLEETCPESMSVDLIAFYLPDNGIEILRNKVVSASKGDVS